MGDTLDFNEYATAEAGLAAAQAALARNQPEHALAIWTALTQQFPWHPQAYREAATLLSNRGRHTEAEAILCAARSRVSSDAMLIGIDHARLAVRRHDLEADPNTLELFTDYAGLATRRKNWSEALRRWKDAQQRFPEATQLGTHVFEAELRVVENLPMDPPAAPVQAHPPLGNEREELRALMLNFESLGGTLQGCEFGLVQRAFGAEPLGLLRWTEMGPGNVIAALEAGLEGVGLPENTQLKVNQTPDGPEYVTVDKRFLMSMHTFVKETEVAPERMFEQSCRRLQYLRDKLLQDLREGTKIFVYKITWRLVTDAELTRMHEGLRKHGNGTLFYVQRATPTKPHGTVELVRPGLIMGYIDRFNISATGEYLGPSHALWLPICRQALTLRNAATAAR